jgi:chromosome segregation ATPase
LKNKLISSQHDYKGLLEKIEAFANLNCELSTKIEQLEYSATSTATDDGLIKKNGKLKAKLASSQEAIENLLAKMEILSIYNNELTTKLENIGSTPEASLVEILEIIKKDASTSCFDFFDNSNLIMDKKKKVHFRDTPKYSLSNDEGSSSDNNDDLISLFANLTMDQKKNINELIETINEKDDILECQEDLLVKENKKFVKLKNAYALDVEKCENLTKELSMCNDSISYLRYENASLNAKIEELNVCKPSISTVEHVTICTRCRDVNVEAR